MPSTELSLGLDIGSTTIKAVLLDADDAVVFSSYDRHYADVRGATARVLEAIAREVPADTPLLIRISGSAGMGLAEALDVPFTQEVIAGTEAIERRLQGIDVAIELGGEDAKITFFGQSVEQRMNGMCAGGTGAFIDQMALLLDTDAAGVDALAARATTIYPIASRCGVFAKADVQPLINEGARREDIAASVLQAVVNQSIASLAAGHHIAGRVAFLGGPLYFMDQLRLRFVRTLGLSDDQAVCPEDGLLFVALGAAWTSVARAARGASVKVTTLGDVQRLLVAHPAGPMAIGALPPLFADESDLRAFEARHSAAAPPRRDLAAHHGPAFLGIDAGSTTTKSVLIDADGALLASSYEPNRGDGLQAVVRQVGNLLAQLPASAYIARAAVTGYGENLVRSALRVDEGIVETMAHYRAARYFVPDVDFILDIGGQDMKAMTIRNGQLHAIQLNEACSSGCGSFIEGFAQSLKRSAPEFAAEGLRSRHPADLGSRCTVFMSSKVKQVQKEGFDVGDISAGLAYSVVKNALFKVIKARHPEALGSHILCQGGTFDNSCVLRAFELISGRQVTRPAIAALMGAFGAAVTARDTAQPGSRSTLLDRAELAEFSVDSEFARCGICENDCLLTISRFPDGRQFVTGNRCERGLRVPIDPHQRKIDLVEYRYQRLFRYRPLAAGAPRGDIGIPRALNMYENYPLWFTVFTDLGFRVRLSPRSTREVFDSGLETLPSDSICFPAKLSHGHVQWLVRDGVRRIFFPCVVYEESEHPEAPNNINCMIVQGYPNVLRHTIDAVLDGSVDYHAPVLDLADPESMAVTLHDDFAGSGDIGLDEWRAAVAHGLEELHSFKRQIRRQGEQLLVRMRERGERGVVLASRPYHGDPEINHGIAKLICQEGFNVFTEDSICHLGDASDLEVLSNWEFASRVFAAAKVVARDDHLDLVQLSSFGCALDSVTTDELQSILAPTGKICTVLKIDEGANLGAVRIRIRSLKEAVRMRGGGVVRAVDLPGGVPRHLGGRDAEFARVAEVPHGYPTATASVCTGSKGGDE
ncbi:hypothetical protein GCM10009785_15990 [Brooklawnia cerclae]|uniref:CoA-substrate-specific enzyme activase n=1 Tax=Brooklawnia cerclae TaxID=349934 RepID=A0ABX0SM73_9ACTN|nr:acyl-CoA dehydratase activase-related protein [Brooklawnia cerclae]NIH57832.1 putative CoA-substrate-specific enzyme activase [Brooklawnia cerclae]